MASTGVAATARGRDTLAARAPDPGRPEADDEQAHDAKRRERAQVDLFRAGRRDLAEELAWIRQLRWDQPEYAASVLKHNEAIVEAAAAGRLQTMVQLALTCREGELLSWTVAKMFRQASAHGHASVIRFMLQHGVNGRHPGLRTLLHDLLESADEQKPLLVTLPILFKEGEAFDVNSMHPADGRTPLHVACARPQLNVFKVLILHGADVHAVALDDSMPLNCALRAAHEASTVDEVVASGEIAKFLRRLGAQESIQLVSYRG